MSTRLVLLLAALAWAAGFLALRVSGSLVPLVLLVTALAALVLTRDGSVRALLRPSPSCLAWGLLGAGGMIAATYVLYPVATRWLPGLERVTVDLYALMHARQLAVGAFLLLVCPTAFAEEVVFRGRLFEGAGRSWSRYALASAAYGLVHMSSGSAALVVIALVCGLFWGALRVLTGSLIPSILAHVLWDLSILVIHPLT